MPGAVEGVAVDHGLVLGLVDEDEEEVEDLGLSALLGVESVLRGLVLRRCWGVPGKVLLRQRVVRHLFLHVVACCPTPTPGPPQVPCQGPRQTAGPPQRQVAAGGLKPPTRSPGDSRVPTRVRDLSQNGSLSLSPSLFPSFLPLGRGPT